jgi:RimJ/RimL family protein N-acetyltransferase
MTDEIVIRPITLADVPGFNACVGVVARERRWIMITEPPPIESTQRFVAGNLDAGSPHLVALDDDRVIGWCDIRPHAFEGFRHCGELGMGLLPGYRGRGLGRRLVEDVLQRSWTFGLSRIELEAYASNVAGIALYQSTGFVREGLKRRARFLDGTWDDIVVMAIVKE